MTFGYLPVHPVYESIQDGEERNIAGQLNTSSETMTTVHSTHVEPQQRQDGAELKQGSGAKSDLFSATVLALLDKLQNHGYDHLCPTPETQAFALAKRQKVAGGQPLSSKNLHDIWGWSLPVQRDV